MKFKRVVHFGIDGGSLRVLDSLASQGLLPEYSKLRASAGSAVLRSTTPWYTVPGWTTWMTGVSAERHGVIYWTALKAHDYWGGQRGGRRFPNSGDIPHPTIFRLLSDAGKKVASLNMPVTFPPEQVNGVMVSGFMGPQEHDVVAYPPGFLDPYPDYLVNPGQGVEDGERIPGAADKASLLGDVEGFAGTLARAAESRHRVMTDLLSDSFDLLSVVHVGADRLSHVAWPEIEALWKAPLRGSVSRSVAHYYQTLDRLLGEAARASEGGLLIVTSDHGQGPPPPRLVAPNAWLAQRRWLRPMAKKVLAASHFVTWPGLRRRVWKMLGRAQGRSSGPAPLVDWDKSLAYAIVFGSSFGVVVEGDRAFQEEVAAALRELEDPETGERPVDRVEFSSDICEGTGLARYPELMVTLRKGYGAIGAPRGAVFRRNEDHVTAWHEAEGMLMALGEGVPAGEHPESSIADVAPTILGALGVGVPDWMDGRAIDWIASSRPSPISVSSAKGPASAAQISSEEEEEIARHLAGLGYLE